MQSLGGMVMDSPTPGALRATRLLLTRLQPGVVIEEPTLIQLARDVDKATSLPALIEMLEDLLMAHEALLAPPPGARTKKVQALLAQAKASSG
jgi:hypothetical protein